MAKGLRFGKHIEETRIVVAEVVPKQFAYVLFVDDNQNDFDYLYEAFAPLYPSLFNTNKSFGDDLLDRVARLDGHKHPVERIMLMQPMDKNSLLSENGTPYTKEMVVALFGESQRHRNR